MPGDLVGSRKENDLGGTPLEGLTHPMLKTAHAFRSSIFPAPNGGRVRYWRRSRFDRPE
jgi:hypothetical protein